LCKEYTVNEMPVELGTTITAFKIENKSISITKRFDNADSSTVYAKYTMAINNILDVFYDYYIGFEGINNQSVHIEEAEIKTTSKKNRTVLLLHIAPVGDGCMEKKYKPNSANW
ncbi:MAG: hypothetical protein GXC73_11480, partial [Chitinophagaceae bacterium]|nr:hypothetical protein [Chitinophagaceae bacterium]